MEPRLRGDHLGICLDGRIIEQRLIGATRATGRSTSSLSSSDARSGLRNRRMRDARRGLGIAHFLLRDRARPGEALPAPLIDLSLFAACLRPDLLGARTRLVGFPNALLARAARL